MQIFKNLLKSLKYGWLSGIIFSILLWNFYFNGSQTNLNWLLVVSGWLASDILYGTWKIQSPKEENLK